MTSLDLLRREFRRDAPDQLWMTDITEHPTREGKVYCCVVLDPAAGERAGSLAAVVAQLGAIGSRTGYESAESAWRG